MSSASSQSSMKRENIFHKTEDDVTLLGVFTEGVHKHNDPQAAVGVIYEQLLNLLGGNL